MVDRCRGTIGFHDPAPETKHQNRSSVVFSDTAIANTATHSDHGNRPERGTELSFCAPKFR